MGFRVYEFRAMLKDQPSGTVHVQKARVKTPGELVSKLLDEAPGSAKGRNASGGGDKSMMIINRGAEHRRK